MDVRRADDRGLANFGWLHSRHTFSFGSYFDPQQAGFSDLLVINDDRVSPGRGFDTHGHRDMEIFSYVLEGGLQHRDSMGTGSVIRPGDVQRMSAGRGVLHSEFNGSHSQPVHFLQIWILPNVTGIAPEYEEKRFEPEDKRGHLRLIASPTGEQGSVTIHQDARVYVGLFAGDEQAALDVAPGRRVYLHVARGRITANGEALVAGDALKLTGEPALRLARGEDAEVLAFDLPGGPD